MHTLVCYHPSRTGNYNGKERVADTNSSKTNQTAVKLVQTGTVYGDSRGKMYLATKTEGFLLYINRARFNFIY